MYASGGVGHKHSVNAESREETNPEYYTLWGVTFVEMTASAEARDSFSGEFSEE
jgi:hypothetical protein